MSNTLPLVRLATPDDVDDIVDMCRRLHAENGLFTLNETRVRQVIEKCFRREGSIVGVIGHPGELRASTCLMFSDFYYTDDWHLAELWNFVEEPYRAAGFRYAEALIEFSKQCALEIRLPLFTGIITNKQMAGKVRLYRRLYGHPVGAFFLFNGRWQSEAMTDHSNLVSRLREQAQKCANNKVKTRAEIEKMASLFREAADAVSSDTNIWGSGKNATRESATPPTNR